MTDDQILHAMGLRLHELEDLLRKTNDYYNSLTRDQKQRFNAIQRSMEEAARTLGGNITAEELETFLRRHGKEVSLRGAWCRHHHLSDEEPPTE